MGGESAFTGFVADTLSITYNSGANTVTITFQYTESGYTFFSGVLCTINGISVTVSSSTGVDGNGTVVILVGNDTNKQFFTQGLTQVYQLSFTYDSEVFNSTSVTYYWRQAIDSNNINLATNPKAFIAIDISPQTKSILLPPVGTKSGFIYRFKIIGYASPFLLRISPYFTTFDNTTSLTVGAAPYDSSIDGALSTIRLQGSNYSIALVSDGTNWSIITLYVASLLTPSVATASGTSSTETTPTQILYHRSSTVFNVIIAPMVYSFIKYICILNQDTSSGTFNIFFPTGKSVDNVTATVSQTIKVSLTIPASSLGTITLIYANNQYYILGYYRFGTGDNITNNTSAERGSILTRGISFTTNVPASGTTVLYEITPVALTSNYSLINIIKLNNDTSSVSTANINRPNTKSSSYFAITNTTTTQQLSIKIVDGASNYRYTCIWLAKYYDSTYDTIILPVHYYLATATGGGISP